MADTLANKIWQTTVPIKRGAQYTEIPVDTSSPFDLDYDPMRDRVYWSDNFTINSVNRDGTEQGVVIPDIGGKCTK